MASSAAKLVFMGKAPGIMRRLMADFPALKLDDTAAVLGNLGHECAGFTKLQEIAPVVKGSKGGYGWPMWTAARRRAYEAWCKANQLDPASDSANYGYVVVELRGPEKRAIKAVTAAIGLAAKVKAFELAFERAGAKHYVSRNQWAAMALEAWHDAAGKPASGPRPVQPSSSSPATPPKPPAGPARPSVPLPGTDGPAKPKRGLWAKLGALVGIGGAAALSQAEKDQMAAIAIGGVALVLVLVVGAVIYRRMRK